MSKNDPSNETASHLSRGVDVTVYWGDAVLATRRVEPPAIFWLSDGSRRPMLGSASAGTEVHLPEGVLDGERVALVRFAEGEANVSCLPRSTGWVVGPDGRSTPAPRELPRHPLAAGSAVVQRIGQLTFVVAAGRAERVEGAGRARPRLGRLLQCCAASVLLHGALAAFAAVAPPPPVDENGLTPDQYAFLQAHAVEEEAVEEETVEEERIADDDREGGTGTRAAGAAGLRYGVRGPAMGANHQALVAAAEFGMIGVLNAGAGGDPDAPLRSAPPAIRGPLSPKGVGTVGPAVGLDPDGRFSTTYRPGRGHLAAFETAVAQGIVPAGARALVSDVGASYAPTIPLSSRSALAHAVHLEREALPPAGGAVHLRLALRSAPGRSVARPKLSVHLVLDVSGSMGGEPLEHARQAATKLVTTLAPSDDFSLITFSNDADVRVPCGPVGPRRALIRAAIAKLKTEGGTNIGAGLELAYEQARRPVARHAVPVVLLLSDGRANQGETKPVLLSGRALRAFQAGIQTSTFGLGVDYDGPLMSAIAADGAGGYYYVRDTDQMGMALSQEIAQRLDPAATAVEIRVRLRDDVQLLRVYGSERLDHQAAARERAKEVAADEQAAARSGIRRDREDDIAGGMRFFIPAFARDDRHALLLQIAVPAGVGPRRIGLVEIKYKDRIFNRNVAEEIPLRVTYASSDADSAQTIDPSVVRTVQGHRAGEDLLAASHYIASGDHTAAVRVLTERGRLLRRAAHQLAEPAFRRDAERFARLLSHLTDRDDHEPRALALLMETAGRSRLR